jgi:hypothetical protein
MKLHLITAGALLTASAMGFATDKQCKVTEAMKPLSSDSRTFALVDGVLYGVKRAEKAAEGERRGDDTIAMINLASGKSKELDIGPAWKYDIRAIATGTGSYIYATAYMHETKDTIVNENGDTNIYSVVLKIAKHDGEIEDMVKIMRHYDDGDERGLGEMKLDEGDDRLYVVTNDEGDFSKMFVIDTDDMKILKNASEELEDKVKDIEDLYNFEDLALDDEQGAFYMVLNNTLHGLTTDGQASIHQLPTNQEKTGYSVSNLAYDREENNLIMTEKDFSNDEVTISRVSLKGKVLSSVHVDGLSMEDVSLRAVFPTSKRNEALVVARSPSRTDEGTSYEPFISTVNLKTGEVAEVCGE